MQDLREAHASPSRIHELCRALPADRRVLRSDALLVQLRRLSLATGALLLLLAPGGRASAERPNALYVELLGKGGLWGLGYDRELTPRLGIGVAASFYILDGEQLTSISPYVAVRLLGGPHHAWFAHGGPQLVHEHIRSPVPEWDGTSSTGIGAEMSSGYEYRDHVLFRAFAMITVGRGRPAPGAGVSLGWTL